MKCEKCGKIIPNNVEACPTCRLIEARHKNNSLPKIATKSGIVPETSTALNPANSVIVSNFFDETIVMENNKVGAGAQSKCPKCGSTDIHLIKERGIIHCKFCQYDFKSLQKSSEDIASLQGQFIGIASTDITQTDNIITLKCQSCSAEVVIDVEEAMQEKCHWCRNVLSVNHKITNGLMPDYVLPFAVTKNEALTQMKSVVKERNFFASKRFKKSLTEENIEAVYLPYMIVDVNATSELIGQGERTIKNGENNDEAELYNVKRNFQLLIDGLTIPASDKRQDESITSNIIDSILPYDTENAFNWNANFLKGCSSEKRTLDVNSITKRVDEKIGYVSRHAANPLVNEYDRGVAWSKETINIKGKRWETIYLPVWLYAFKAADKTHYIAVNARTKNANGSIPMSKFILTLITSLIFAITIPLVIASFIVLGWGGLFTLPLIIAAPLFYDIIEHKYHNPKARNAYEEHTKTEILNLKKEDNFVENRKTLLMTEIVGANNNNINLEYQMNVFRRDGHTATFLRNIFAVLLKTSILKRFNFFD